MGRKKVEIDSTKVEALAAQGLTHQQIADTLGISRTTLHHCRKKNEQIEQAIKAGKAKGIALVTNKLFEKCKDGNVTAMIFYLKTQAGWRETHVVDNKSSDGSMTPAASEPFTQEQLEDALKSVMDKI